MTADDALRWAATIFAAIFAAATLVFCGLLVVTAWFEARAGAWGFASIVLASATLFLALTVWGAARGLEVLGAAP